jgi:hypothetical protein
VLPPAPPLLPQREAIARVSIPRSRSLALIAITAWIANYLHFTRFGLYEDDWFFSGAAYLHTLPGWLELCWSYIVHPGRAQGRPLQFAANMLFPLAGRFTSSFAADYLIAFAMLAGSAAMMYLVLRRRFSNFTATFAALLFVTTPLHTLRQFLNGQFSFGPAFLIVFGAMLLYLSGRRWVAYAVAPLALLSYESMFFLYLGTPLLQKGRAIHGRRKEWLIHGAFCGVVVLAYFAARKLLFNELRVNELQGPLQLVGPVLRDWAFYAWGSFATYYYALLRAARQATAEAWLWFLPVLAAAAFLAWRERRRLTPRGRLALWLAAMKPVWVGLAFLVLGYVVSYFYFIFLAGRYPYTGRVTRVSVAGSFGSSLIFAGLLDALTRCLRRTRFIPLAASAVLFGICFLSSFAIQLDYVNEWEIQRRDMEQIIAATPDVQPDSLIVLRLPFRAPGLPEQPGIGDDRNAFDRIVPSVFIGTESTLPRLFIVMTDDWRNYLKATGDGRMAWLDTAIPGRWYPSVGPYRAGRFITLEQSAAGKMVRSIAPVLVDGVDIIQRPPAGGTPSPLWRQLRRTPLGRKLIPAFDWDSRHGQVAQ